MKHFLILAIAAFSITTLSHAQTVDLVVFSDDGGKFTLIVDGDVKNAEPASRVVATGLRNESPVVMVRFEEASIPQMRKPLYLPAGKEYTVMITTNKKGERVLRNTGEAALGTATPEAAPKPSPVTFMEDKPAVAPASTITQQTIDVDGFQQVTTVTVVEEEPIGNSTGKGEDISISMGMPGVGFDVKVRVDENGSDIRSTGTQGVASARTTTTTTTTTTGSTGTKPQAARPTLERASAPEPVTEVYRMPGYSGPVGCAMPMSATEFSDAKKSIESKNFEDTKMTMAKQIGRDRCFTAEQVKAIMATFSFEDSKLDFARYAYERTHDIGNYYKLNDAFTFESSVEDLNEFLQIR